MQTSIKVCFPTLLRNNKVGELVISTLFKRRYYFFCNMLWTDKTKNMR